MCIIVFTEAPYHEEMTVTDGEGSVQDIIQLLQQENIRLFIYAPEMACYYDFAQGDEVVYEAIEITDPFNPDGAVNALRSYISDTDNFRKILEQLAKTVIQSEES